MVRWDLGQVAAADRRELREVPAGQHVDAAEGSRAACGVQLEAVHVGLHLAQALVHRARMFAGTMLISSTKSHL